MAKKKKGARLLVGLICTECGRQDYVTTYNKLNTQKLELMKYSPQLKKHTLHKVRLKLK